MKTSISGLAACKFNGFGHDRGSRVGGNEQFLGGGGYGPFLRPFSCLVLVNDVLFTRYRRQNIQPARAWKRSDRSPKPREQLPNAIPSDRSR